MNENGSSKINKTIRMTENILNATEDIQDKEQIKQLFMYEQLKNSKNKLKEKHYLRMNGLLLYDLEGRDIKEQKIILKTAIEVANNLLEKLNK